jgi:hypothetical protein
MPWPPLLPAGNPNTHCIGSCVGPKAGRDVLEEKIIFPLTRIGTPERPVCSVVAISTTLQNAVNYNYNYDYNSMIIEPSNRLLCYLE